MKTHHISHVRLLGILMLVTVVAFQLFMPVLASASQITARSLTLVANGSNGGSKPGGVVNHAFAFTLPGGSNVGSIKFQYCTTAADSSITPTCVKPKVGKVIIIIGR